MGEGSLCNPHRQVPSSAQSLDRVDDGNTLAVSVPATDRPAPFNLRIAAFLTVSVLGIVGATGQTISGKTLLVIAALFAVVVAGATMRQAGGWIAPTGLPLLYLTALHTIPMAMAGRFMFEGQQATVVNGVVSPSMMTDSTTRALALLLLGFAAGTLGTAIRPASTLQVRNAIDEPRPALMAIQARLVGRVCLVLAIGLQAVYFARNGFARFAPTAFDKELTTMGRIFLFAGVVCVLVAFGQNATSLKSLGGRDALLIAAACLLAMTWGSRSALLAPGLLLAFAMAVRKPKGPRQVVILGLAGFLCFVLLAETRIKGTENLEGFSVSTIVERTVRDLNAPTYLTFYTIQATSAGYEFADGSTYVAAVTNLAPSAAMSQLGVNLPEVATDRYRDMIGFDRSNRGFGLATVAEAVMNFGVPGALAAGVVLGLVLSWAYRMMILGATTVPRAWLYPILFASFPWLVRSDLLQGIKPILYAVLALVASSWLSKAAVNATSGATQ